jgi:hypothetical protein
MSREDRKCQGFSLKGRKPKMAYPINPRTIENTSVGITTI